MDKPYFRIGVGMILYDATGHIYCFERSDKTGVWQFPQGGVDAGETYEDTLWRELKEETGLHESAIMTITPFPEWTLYEYPSLLRTETKTVVGQAHRWFFLKLKPHHLPDLAKATDQEFTAWQALTMDEFLALKSHDFKLPVYQILAQFFKDHGM